eukprot:1292567-Rhodomonas_salina.1
MVHLPFAALSPWTEGSWSLNMLTFNHSLVGMQPPSSRSVHPVTPALYTDAVSMDNHIVFHQLLQQIHPQGFSHLPELLNNASSSKLHQPRLFQPPELGSGDLLVPQALGYSAAGANFSIVHQLLPTNTPIYVSEQPLAEGSLHHRLVLDTGTGALVAINQPHSMPLNASSMPTFLTSESRGIENNVIFRPGIPMASNRSSSDKEAGGVPMHGWEQGSKVEDSEEEEEDSEREAEAGPSHGSRQSDPPSSGGKGKSRELRPYQPKKCEHNRQRNKCVECCGAGICEHNRLRRICKLCCGNGICEHNRQRNIC